MGPQAGVVALTGVACPFVLGFALATWWGNPTLVALFVGAMLTATSVGITARVLSDLGRLQEAAASSRPSPTFSSRSSSSRSG